MPHPINRRRYRQWRPLQVGRPFSSYSPGDEYDEDWSRKTKRLWSRGFLVRRSSLPVSPTEDDPSSRVETGDPLPEQAPDAADEQAPASRDADQAVEKVQDGKWRHAPSGEVFATKAAAVEYARVAANGQADLSDEECDGWITKTETGRWAVDGVSTLFATRRAARAMVRAIADDAAE